MSGADPPPKPSPCDLGGLDGLAVAPPAALVSRKSSHSPPAPISAPDVAAKAPGEGDECSCSHRLRHTLAVLTHGVGTGMIGMFVATLIKETQVLGYGFGEGNFLTLSEHCPSWRRVTVCFAGGLFGATAWYLLRNKAVTDKAERQVKVSEWEFVPVKSAIKDGRTMPPLVTWVNGCIQVMVVALGASIGREAAPREMAAMLGCWLSRRLRLTKRQRCVLVACGTGAGLTAVYSVPVAGTLYTLEVCLDKDYRLDAVIPAIITSIIATVVASPVVPTEPLYRVPQFGNQWPSASLVTWSIVIGPIVGLFAALFTKGVTEAETRQPGKPGGPPLAALFITLPAVFLFLGLVSVDAPSLLGNGRSLAQIAMRADFPFGYLCPLFVLKLALTTCTIGAGAAGGTLTPSVAAGATLGAVLGGGWAVQWPGSPLEPMALVASGAFLSATMRAPVTALFLIIEFSGQGCHDPQVAWDVVSALCRGDTAPLLATKFGIGMLLPVALGVMGASRSHRMFTERQQVPGYNLSAIQSPSRSRHHDMAGKTPTSSANSSLLSPDGAESRRPTERDCLRSCTTVLMTPLRLYLRYPVRLQAHVLVGRLGCAVPLVMYIVFFAGLATAIGFSIYGAINLLPEGAEYNTEDLLVNWPVVISFKLVISFIVTHNVLCFYARTQFRDLLEGKIPPSPAMFVFVVVKIFTLIRLIMFNRKWAQASEVVDYFIHEEVILISLQVLFDVCLLPLFEHAAYRGDLQGMRNCSLSIILIGVVKTMCAFALYLNFEPGWVARYVERLPSQPDRILFIILTHVMLNIIQEIVEVYAMWIARKVRIGCCSERLKEDYVDGDAEQEPLLEAFQGRVFAKAPEHFAERLAVFAFVQIDGYWYRHVFFPKSIRPTKVPKPATPRRGTEQAGSDEASAMYPTASGAGMQTPVRPSASGDLSDMGTPGQHSPAGYTPAGQAGVTGSFYLDMGTPGVPDSCIAQDVREVRRNARKYISAVKARYPDALELFVQSKVWSGVLTLIVLLLICAVSWQFAVTEPCACDGTHLCVISVQQGLCSKPSRLDLNPMYAMDTSYPLCSACEVRPDDSLCIAANKTLMGSGGPGCVAEYTEAQVSELCAKDGYPACVHHVLWHWF